MVWWWIYISCWKVFESFEYIFFWKIKDFVRSVFYWIIETEKNKNERFLKILNSKAYNKPDLIEYEIG